MVHIIPCKNYFSVIFIAFVDCHSPSSQIMIRDSLVIFCAHFGAWFIPNCISAGHITHKRMAKLRLSIVLLGNLLCCLVGENIKSWDSKLTRAKFTHNIATDRSIRLCPFQVVYVVIQRTPVDMLTFTTN